VQTGTQISSPAITVFDDQSLGLVFSQVVNGVRRVTFAKLALATGATSALTDVTQGAGDAAEPAIATYFDPFSFSAAIAWADSRSGARQLYFQRVAKDGSLSGAAEIVSPAAVGPADPILVPIASKAFRVSWTDGRDGGNAIYSNSNASGNWVTAGSEARVSPLGIDAQHVRMPVRVPAFATYKRMW
jgi:hypothetical protein